MKILFATVPADGHFNPLTGIAMHLQQQGHDVRWYAGPSYGHKLDELGIAYFAYHRAREVSGENLATLFPERAKLKGPKLISFDLEQVFVANVGHYFRDILDIQREFSFDAFFCDGGFYASKLVAEKLHVPVYAIGVGPLLATSPDVPPPFFGLRPADTAFRKLVHRGVRTMLHTSLKSGARRYNAILAAEGIRPVQLRDWFNLSHQPATRYFQSGVPGLDYPRGDVPPNVTFVGPLLPHKKKAGAGMAFLHRERVREHPSAVIAVSQGTVDNLDPRGIDLRTERPTSKAIARSIARILTDERVGRNVARIRAELDAHHPFEIIDRCIAEDAAPLAAARSTAGRSGTASTSDA